MKHDEIESTYQFTKKQKEKKQIDVYGETEGEVLMSQRVLEEPTPTVTPQLPVPQKLQNS